ncbi:MAG: fibro-slime domain-containing protein [Lachnospiraceae bacterium]|nr:fibro-slime domain-containing protein [Lachnospiraceae bacterium]
MSSMKKRNVFCRNTTVSVVLFLIIVITYQVILGNTSTVTAATGYPDTLVKDMQHLAEQDYVFIDVSNMRLQQDGIGPSWNKAAILYYRNVTKGTGWRASATATSEGLSDEEKKMVRELRQSNIFCWKITDADTDSIEFSYSNDNTVNKDHYYRTAAYKASDIKGNLHAYLASYTAKAGDNEGKKAYMLGQVTLPKVEKQESEEESEEEKDLTAKEQESKNESTSDEEESEEKEVNEEEIEADLNVKEQISKNGETAPVSSDGTYSVDELVAIYKLLEKDYFLLDTTNMTLGGTNWWNASGSRYYWNYTKSTGWTSTISLNSTGLTSDEQTLIKNQNIYCYDLSSVADTDSLIFGYSNVWNTINGNNYYRTDLYTASELKGSLYTNKGTTSINNKTCYTLGKVTLEKSPLAGKTVYFDTGTSTNPKIKLIYGGTTKVVEMQLSYKQSNVYEYTFPDNLPPGTQFQFSANGTSYVPDTAVENIASSTPCYDLNTSEWKTFSPIDSKVRMEVMFDYADGATVVYVNSSGIPVKSYDIAATGNIIVFDLASNEYAGFYIEKKDATTEGNRTEIQYKEAVERAVNDKGSMRLTLTNGGWTSDYQRRTVSYAKVSGAPDNSLDIPTGNYEKASNTFYATATFYDYYSDYEIFGNMRKNYKNDNPSSVAVRVQADMFNTAVGEYFKDKGAIFPDESQSPLYFGDFYDFESSDINGYDIGKNYPGFVYKNNNGNNNFVPGSDTILGPKQGLVNENLVDNKVVMGTNNVEVPYFNEEFLRGTNYYNDNLGYVFENVEFPFQLNEEGYWEFDSYNSKQSLRMKKDRNTGKYFLDRTGEDGAVHGAVVGYPTANSNFFPFNDAEESGKDVSLNYGYGAKIEIPFFMTADGKITVITTDPNGVTSEEKRDIEFNFRGDDDIWIFIDDELILDIGGDHAAVSGTINFADLKATVTGIHTDEASTNYEDEIIAKFTKEFERITPSKRHVLTLYYMERGIWESNMQISFNFPQSNILEVEKEVKIPEEINDMFKPAMDTLQESIPFPISIDNMATSGSPQGVSVENEPVDAVFDLINAKTQGNFEWATGNPQSTSDYLGVNNAPDNTPETFEYKVIKAKSDKDGQEVTDLRSAKIYYHDENGNRTHMSFTDKQIEQIKKGGYVEFKAYLNYYTAGSPFVALIDGKGNRIGGWVSGLTYTGGESSMKPYTWTTIKVDIPMMEKAAAEDLKKLDGSENGEFDYANIVAFQFSHWAPSPSKVFIDDIYIKAPAIYTSTAGFTKEQNDIPDYGSVDSKKLEPINGAEYTINSVTDETINITSSVTDGKIYLKNSELATFRDQFRRKSYLAINEECDSNVFDTKWEIFEDGVLTNIKGNGTTVNDEREEENPGNEGATKPNEETMLFASYNEEYKDDTTHFYDLRVKYTNTLKLGSIKIQKKTKDGQGNLVDTSIPYKVRITFSNIAGMALEGSAYEDYRDVKEVTLDASGGPGNAIEITGIPAGTTYRIEELTTDDSEEERDDFILIDMSRSDNANDDGGFYMDDMAYQGTVVADTEDEIVDVITITNDINPLTTLTGQKTWKVEDGNTAPDPLPIGIKLKLQRRFIAADGTSETYEYKEVLDKDSNPIEFAVKDAEASLSVTCKDGNVLTIKTEADYKYSIEGLPLYGVTDINGEKRRRKYEYRLVETAIIRGDTEETVVELTTSNDAASSEVDIKTGYQVTGGEAVTDGEGNVSYDITNTYNPETNLQITKVSGNDGTTVMNGVTFKLEKLVKNTSGELDEDTSFTSREATTSGNGAITFLALQDGFYRLTEIKTISGYSLLAAPINISISRLNGSIASVNNVQYSLDITNNTILLTVSNQGLLELPMTGSNGRKIVIVLGICLAVGGEGLYLWNLQSYRKHRRRRRRK